MNLGRLIAREITRDITRSANRTFTYHRLQAEAANRPESTKVQTPGGDIWMSPIEFKLYKAMRDEGLSPTPQFYIQGYYADFAFPDVRLAVEADGAAYHEGQRHERDRKRDWILRRAGWTVKRFHGTTIHSRAANCAYVIKQEVDARRKQVALRLRQIEEKRRARNEAILSPLRKLASLLKRK